MRDALGHVQSILVLGGTSEIAVATTLALAPGRVGQVVVTEREPSRADATVERLHNAGISDVRVVAFDARDTASHAKIIEGAFSEYGDFDLVLLAFGVLGDQYEFDHDPEAAADAALVNYVGAVSRTCRIPASRSRHPRGAVVRGRRTRPQEQLRVRELEGRPRRFRTGPG